MYYKDLKNKNTYEIKELLGSLEAIDNVNPLICICMDLCDRIARLEEQVEIFKPKNKEGRDKTKNLLSNNGKKTNGEKTSKLKEHIREAALVAEKQDNSGEFNPMSWLDLELENNPGSFDSFFDKIWDELTENEQAQRTIALRRVL
jgi:hypothetical protein